MPIYTYKCLECDHLFDVLFRAAGPPSEDEVEAKVSCPANRDEGGRLIPGHKQHKGVKRVPTVSTFQLSGDGWASDGYKGSKKS